MFEIGKAKFGAFVAQLRKEKGLMQKELAEKLYVSDKAVSKWERGLSIPDVAILVPLADILGVTVTELLECRRLPKDEPMDSQQTEEIVKKVIGLSEEEQLKYRPDRLKRGLQLLLCTAVGVLEIWLLTMLGYSLEELSASLGTMMILMAIFGLYFCVFTKEKLPRYYDENRISSFSDGFLRMNVPGVYFNNRNWPHIVRAGQLWAMIGLVASPVIYYLMTTFLPEVWDIASVYIILLLVLGGLFIPMIVVARKYEYTPENPRPKHANKRDWIWICSCMIAVVNFVFILRSGVAPTGSGLQMGWVESNTRDYWSATYAFHDGYQQRTINTDGEPTTLEVEIVSSSGEIGLVITDENGNVVFQDEQIETSSFEIEIPGKVTVKITGDDHKGSNEVLIVAPEIWVKVDESGYGMNSWNSEEAVKNDPNGEGAVLAAWNDSFFAGEVLPLLQLYRTEEEGPVIRVDAAPAIGAVLSWDGGPIAGAMSDTYIVTTEQGLENMGFPMEGLWDVRVYLDGDISLEEEETLERQLNAIARRNEGYTVFNYLENYREREAAKQQQILLYAAIAIVFFSVSVGMIVSSVTRQLNSEGRTIGMLRAVGADEKAILDCYSGRINASVIGGMGISFGLFLFYFLIYLVNAIRSGYLVSSEIKLMAVISATIASLGFLCLVACKFLLRFRIREIVNKSIIDNIREL